MKSNKVLLTPSLPNTRANRVTCEKSLKEMTKPPNNDKEAVQVRLVTSAFMKVDFI